ncbi:hypothetical protein GA0061102_108410 [Rhizobium miluonense]|uniref:Uncharacterized protein n=1 Tax=Rhizobium miluonense TaxID=411945 RepID=A0A1C3XD26_9HYPH|nr:hypothetical protein GA0061102_108410 [Rhizobium miluonense]
MSARLLRYLTLIGMAVCLFVGISNLLAAERPRISDLMIIVGSGIAIVGTGWTLLGRK